MPTFFCFSLLGSANRHRFMQRIEEIKDEGVGLFLVSHVSVHTYLANLFCLIPSLLMIHLKEVVLRVTEVYLPLLGNPSIPHLTSSFLLPLFPCCPALCSQHPSPINLPFSSLTFFLRLLKTGVSGIAKTLIFDHPNHHLPLLPQFLCHGSGAACMLPPS